MVLLHGFGQFDATSELTPLTALAEEIAQLDATCSISSGTRMEVGQQSPGMTWLVWDHSLLPVQPNAARSDRVVIVGHSMGAEGGSNLAFRSFDLPTNGDCTETGSQATTQAFLGAGGSYGGIGIPVDADQESFLSRSGCNEEPRELSGSDVFKLGLTAQQGFELGGYSSMDLATADLRVVLLVGTLDPNPCTSPDITRDFAKTLETNGIDTQLVEVVGAGHEDVINPHTDPGKNTLTIIESLLAGLQD